MEPLLLAIDIGTSALKAALFSEDGTVIASAAADYPVYYPREGWAEQNPEEWWRAVCVAVKRMLGETGIDPKRIIGVGIDGQSWSAIAIDVDGKVLCNTPIWMDTRAKEICDRLEKKISAERIFSVCGNSLKPSYTLPKILWYKENQPAIYEHTYKILQSNGFIAYRLTGAITTDICQAYGLQCFDMRKGQWDFDLCETLGVDKNMLPEIVACHEIVGKVTPEASEQCGIPAGVPVVAGGLDAACGALGGGVLNDGDTQEQGGQAGGMSICLDTYRTDPRLIMSYHVIPNRWLLQGGSVGGSGILRWFAQEFCAEECAKAVQNSTNPYIEMDAAAGKIPAGADGIVFLPYMAGERSPIWDVNAKGVYYGLDYAKKRAHLIRANMESVAYSLRHNLETAENAGASVKKMFSVGGAANSRLWTQIKADITGIPIDIPSTDAATTLGAAMLAGVAVGLYPDFDEAVRKTVRISRSHTPDLSAKPVYDKTYQTYLSVYEQLKPIMQKGAIL